jgi:hypothetical protein
MGLTERSAPLFFYAFKNQYKFEKWTLTYFPSAHLR